MTTYQKLKAENLRLRQELDKVCNEPGTLDAFNIKMKYRLNRAAERVIWAGGTIQTKHYDSR